MKTQITHDTFTIDRTFRADRARAFRAWTSADEKRKWFVGPAGRWTEVRREVDFQVGGQEVLVGSFSVGGSSGFFATFQHIVDQTRIVYSYRMFVDEELLSVSLVTVEFADSGTGCQTKFTEQAVYFGDATHAANRLQGSQMLMDNFINSLEKE